LRSVKMMAILTLEVQIIKISTSQLVERKKSDKPYVLVDARPFDLYDRCYLLGAVSITEWEVEAHADKYGRNIDIIIYDSAIFCKESTMTAIRFAQMGFIHVYDYGGGMLEWLQNGCPTECFTLY
jgi:rhodanese-related sulfurtransferase